MSLEQIKIIKDTEESADKIRRESVEESKHLLQRANQKAGEIIQAAKNKGELSYKEVISEAETEAQLTYNQIISDAEKQCETILSTAVEKLDEAVSVIVGRIVKTSGNS
nr:hypothetical protein [uncultured Aminipila sp.]